MKAYAILALFVFTFGCAANINAGGGDFTQTAGGKTLALNGMYFAGSDGIAGMMSNPASLAYLKGRALEIQISDRMGDQYFDGAQNGYFQSFRNDDVSFHGGAHWNFYEGFTLGLGYYPVARYDVSWPFTILKEKGTSSQIFAYDFENKLTVNSITPGVSYRFGSLNIGIAANIYQVKLSVNFPQTNNMWLPPTDSGSAAYQFSYSMDGWAYGFTLGLDYEITPEALIGLSVRSPFKAELSGDASSSMFAELHGAAGISGVETEYQMPWVIGLGGVYNLSNELRINADVRYNMWESIEDNMDVTFGDAFWQSQQYAVDPDFGVRADKFFVSYDNSIDAGIGLEYAPTYSVKYRAGYRYSQTPFKYAMYNMLFSSVDQHWFTLGVGVVEGEWELDITAAYSLGVEKEVKGAVPVLNGKYDNQMFLPSLGLRYNF